ncbi:MAG: hypothetical protein US60_C0047G0002 [Microgenomates group bacterium GW2011_GWC1_37_8]|nr:MAG: hypothetical protein US60_C0047G0002 [Microgenomates group bacterium GW2011_GWC1_37_8]
MKSKFGKIRLLARMVELVDTQLSKSCELKRSCRFESDFGHQTFDLYFLLAHNIGMSLAELGVNTALKIYRDKKGEPTVRCIDHVTGLSCSQRFEVVFNNALEKGIGAPVAINMAFQHTIDVCQKIHGNIPREVAVAALVGGTLDALTNTKIPSGVINFTRGVRDTDHAAVDIDCDKREIMTTEYGDHREMTVNDRARCL